MLIFIICLISFLMLKTSHHNNNLTFHIIYKTTVYIDNFPPLYNHCLLKHIIMDKIARKIYHIVIHIISLILIFMQLKVTLAQKKLYKTFCSYKKYVDVGVRILH